MMKVLTLFMLFFSASIVVAQETLITDRPDQTESPNAVKPSEIQIETGFLYQRVEISNTSSQHRLVYPTSLFRIGLVKNLELRLVNELVTYSVVDNEKQEKVKQISGMENLQLGFKYQFSKDDAITIVGLLVHAILPTGSSGIGSQNYGIFSRVNVSHQISDKQSLSANFGYNNYRFRFDEDGLIREVDGDLIYTLVYGHALSSRVGVYIEAYGDFVNFDFWINNMDAGLTYLINNNIQLDYSFGLGLDQVMNYHSIGISLRLQN